MADKEALKASKKENQRFHKVKMIRQRIKHGLFLLTLRNALMRIGLDFEPYWLELESPDFCSEPMIKDDKSLYRVEIVHDDIIENQFGLLGWSSKMLEEKIHSDHLSTGLYRNDDLAAFMIVRLNSYNSKGRTINLDKCEAYLENMYTFDNYRGKNLAPYLRYKSYMLLKKQGFTRFYSGSQYFNKSSLRFKEKLGAKHLEFWLHIGLFKKFKWDFLLKEYNLKDR